MYIQALIIFPIENDMSQQIQHLFLPAMMQSIYNQAETNIAALQEIVGSEKW